jgi:biopolymer transport protein ExbB
MNVDTLLHFANRSGGVLYAIAAMLFIALTIIVERMWYLQRVAGSCDAALAQFARLEAVSYASLTPLVDRFSGLPVGSLFATAIRMPADARREDLDARLEETLMREAPRIDRFLWVLDTVVTLAPLLGLFGTIVGMFNAFQVLSDPGNAPTQVTGGVAQALVATASGLFVAMIGLVFFNGLHNRARIVAHQLETLKAGLVNRLAGAALQQVKAARDVAQPLVGTLAQRGA